MIQGRIQGGVFGVSRPPLQTVLILKQALQIIILIGAKQLFKMPEPARLCLGIHIRNNALDHSL